MGKNHGSNRYYNKKNHRNLKTTPHFADMEPSLGMSSIQLSDGEEDDPSSATISVPFELGMWDFEQCDPKRCTGKKLSRMGFVKELQISSRFHGISLSPRGKSTISPQDRDLILAHGIAVVDCSWASLSSIPFDKMKCGQERLCKRKTRIFSHCVSPCVDAYFLIPLLFFRLVF
eukprot:Sdes_comp19086_c0_seq2m9727